MAVHKPTDLRYIVFHCPITTNYTSGDKIITIITVKFWMNQGIECIYMIEKYLDLS